MDGFKKPNNEGINTMNTYKVKARMTTYLETEIQAETEQDAWDMANLLDGGEFIESDRIGGWDIQDVIEIENYTCPKFEPA
jgi:hypothetical protein